MKVLVLNGPNLGRLDLRDSNIYGDLDADSNTPVVINPAAFTHYSYAIRDAADMVKAPLIEVHLSNPMSREEFRHTSVISGVANGTIAGFGADSYRLALIALSRMIK